MAGFKTHQQKYLTQNSSKDLMMQMPTLVKKTLTTNIEKDQSEEDVATNRETNKIKKTSTTNSETNKVKKTSTTNCETNKVRENVVALGIASYQSRHALC